MAFLNKQNWLNKELIIWSGLLRLKDSLFGGTALKNDKFHLQKNFWTPASPIQVRQPFKRDGMLF